MLTIRTRRQRHGAWPPATILALAALCLPVFARTATAPAHPAIFWTSGPVAPGDTALLFGDGLGGCTSVRLMRLPNGPVTSVRPIQNRPRSIKVVIPAGMGAGVYRATIAVPGGAVSAIVNRPDILWAQGDAGPAGTPGGFVRIQGRCLAIPGARPLVWLTDERGAVTLPVSSAEPFSLRASLPAGLKPGAYRLTVESTAAGEEGRSLPISFAVTASHSRNRPTVDVTSFGADGEDELDDSYAVRQAIAAAAKQGGGIVTFPRGHFVLEGEIALPPGVALRGAGRDLTALCWKNTETPPDALIRGTHDFAVEDLTLYAVNQRHGIVGDQNLPGAGHIALKNLRLRLNPYRGHQTVEEESAQLKEQMNLSSGGGDSLRLGGDDVEVSGCDIDGGGRCLYLSGGHGVWIHDNTLINGRWGWYCLSGNQGVIFERNTVAGGDLMSTGGGLNCLDGSMVSQNVYFAQNHLRRMYGWDREAMTTDAGGGAYYGRIASAEGATVTLAADGDWNGRDWKGAGLFILDGKGQGQYRQVVRESGRTVTLETPWTVAPDESSIITITAVQRNYLFVENSFEDAGVAIQMYGAAIGNIAYRNVSTRTGGFHNFGMNYDGVQPSWFVQWLENRIDDGNVFGGGHDQSVAVGDAHLGVYALPTGKTPEAPVTLCGIMRGNHLEANAHLGIGGTPDGPGGAFPTVQEVIAEHNVVRHASCGLLLSKAVEGVLLRDNAYTDCGVGVTDEDPAARHHEMAAKRLLARFASDPGPLLRLPLDHEEDGAFPDATGHGFAATPHGTVRVENGAVTLDGAGWLTVRQSDLLRMGSCTVSLRVRPQRTTGRYGLLSKRLSGSETPLILSITGDRLGFESTDAEHRWSFNFAAQAPLQAGVWQTVAAVIEAGKGVRLYVNGKLAGSLENSGQREQNNDELCIGREAWGGDPPKGDTPAFFHGQIADVRIYARAFTDQEVAALSAP